MRNVHVRNAILGMVIGAITGLILSFFDLGIWGAILVGAGIGILGGAAIALRKRRARHTA